MGTWITLTEAERKSDEEAKAREVRIGQSLKINLRPGVDDES